MKAAIFKEEDNQKKFERDGYLKIELFTEKEVKDLQELYIKYFPDGVDAFYSSSYLDDFELKSEMSSAITEIIKDRLHDQFTNFRLIGSAFLVKGMGAESEMPMHQDWTIVDENQYFAANIWIPLTETNATNGTIEVLKGSHNWNEAIRAPTLPFFFDGFQDEIKKSLTRVDAKPGEVVVLNQAVIHYSKPNLSSDTRPAITCGLISKPAPLIFHYWNSEKKDEVEILEQDDDFLLRFENFHQAIYKRPLMGRSVGFKKYKHPSLTKEQLEELTGQKIQDTHPKRTGFFSRLFGK